MCTLSFNSVDYNPEDLKKILNNKYDYNLDIKKYYAEKDFGYGFDEPEPFQNKGEENATNYYRCEK
jgi:hypothetical protein